MLIASSALIHASVDELSWTKTASSSQNEFLEADETAMEI
jgi:hypothetical protein